MISAERSSGRKSFSEPLLARPIGERAAETMTASGMGTPFEGFGATAGATVDGGAGLAVRRWSRAVDGAQRAAEQLHRPDEEGASGLRRAQQRGQQHAVV